MNHKSIQRNTFKKILQASSIGLVAFIGVYALPQISQRVNMAALSFSGQDRLTVQQKAIRKSATRWQIDPKMMYAICMIESNCGKNTHSKSSTARGIYQYLKITWVESLTLYIKATYDAQDTNSVRLKAVLGNCHIVKKKVKVKGKTRIKASLAGNCSRALSERDNVYTMADIFAFDRKRRDGKMSLYAKRNSLTKNETHYLDHFSHRMSSRSAQRSNWRKPFRRVMGNSAARANGFTRTSFGGAVRFFQKRYKKFAAKTPPSLLTPTSPENSIAQYAAYDTSLTSSNSSQWNTAGQALQNAQETHNIDVNTDSQDDSLQEQQQAGDTIQKTIFYYPKTETTALSPVETALQQRGYTSKPQYAGQQPSGHFVQKDVLIPRYVQQREVRIPLGYIQKLQPTSLELHGVHQSVRTASFVLVGSGTETNVVRQPATTAI